MKIFRYIPSVAITMFAALSTVSGAAQTAGDSTLDKYAIALNLVFPTEWRQCRPPSRLSFGTYQVTVRILPSFWQESQIFFCLLDNGETFVVHSTLDPKDTMVWTPIIEAEEKGARTVETPETIASRFHVIHKSCKVDPSTVAGWLRELATVHMDLPESGGGSDGVIYEVTLVHGMDKMEARIWDGDEKKTIILLVDRIQAEIDKASCVDVSRDSEGAGDGHGPTTKPASKS